MGTLKTNAHKAALCHLKGFSANPTRATLIKIGDWAIKSSPSKDDDVTWEEVVKPFIKDNF